ncbi:alcohol dehydrogenase [Trichonephila inaurata madagascariensis]|uniref:Alcohol dehydrogenase n=1 Tax=Trichonephila inaurata madagascariensis TaxID=2747483 RepID=A0A8X7BPT0_9ARAC|nr:alcohol dehydrogenase [Trichonephila inaurata madagascariensis]
MRGTYGPMPVHEFDTEKAPLAKAFLKGASDLGIQLGDLNGVLDNGAMPAQTNTYRGWRVSTVDAYLDPIIDTANIQILTNSQVLKIPVIINNPEVGQNLRDHLNLPLYFNLEAPVSITTAKARSISEIWKYSWNGEVEWKQLPEFLSLEIIRPSRKCTSCCSTWEASTRDFFPPLPTSGMM